MKKPSLMIALGLGKPGKKSPSEMGGGSGSEEAAQALIDAIKSGEAKAVASAFSDMMAVCDDEASYDEEDEADEEDD